jgi:hypothetical protein
MIKSDLPRLPIIPGPRQWVDTYGVIEGPFVFFFFLLLFYFFPGWLARWLVHYTVQCASKVLNFRINLVLGTHSLRHGTVRSEGILEM